MRLKYQIFLTLLAASALIIALMFAINSWSFSRGFLDYVNKSELQRLEPFGEQLVEQYNQEGGHWDWVNDESMRAYRNDSKTKRPRGLRDGQGSDRRQPPPPPQGTGFRADRRGPPLLLTDAQKNTIYGSANPAQEKQWLPLKNDDQVIGYLAMRMNSTVDRQFDQVFAAKQKKTLGWTALAMILLSGLLSIPLATRIVRPLLSVNNAVDEISGGNYAHRVDIDRRDELGDLARNVNTLGVTLEENRNVRQRWIAEISHELRTPLAVLRGEIEAVQDGVRPLDKAGLDSLHSEALHLGRLVDDLHTLSMSDVGTLDYQMEATNIGIFLSEFFVGHKAKLTQSGITLNLNGSDLQQPDATLVQGDVQRLEQLFSNLLQNTCRYTDSGGQLVVECNVHPAKGIVVDWYDSSPGVTASALPRLFDPLFRGEHSRNRASGGSGLGLSIAKRIVDAHNGTITAGESPIGGLHIQISLPSSGRNA